MSDLVDGWTHLSPWEMEFIEVLKSFSLLLDQLWIQWKNTSEESPHVDQAIYELLGVLHTKGGDHEVQVFIIDVPNQITSDTRIFKIDV